MRFERVQPEPTPRDVRVTLTETEARRLLQVMDFVQHNTPALGSMHHEQAAIFQTQLRRILGLDK